MKSIRSNKHQRAATFHLRNRPRWHFLLEWFRRLDTASDRLLVLDTSPYLAREHTNRQSLVFRRKNAHTDLNSPLRKQMEETCKQLVITYSFKDEYLKAENEKREEARLKKTSLGSTERGRIITASEQSVQGTTHSKYRPLDIPLFPKQLLLSPFQRYWNC